MKHNVRTHQKFVELKLRELFGNFSDFSIYEGDKGYKRDQEIDWQLLNKGPTDKVKLFAITRQSESIELDKIFLLSKKGNVEPLAHLLKHNPIHSMLSRIIRQISKHITENNIQIYETFPGKISDNTIMYKNTNDIFLTINYDIEKWDTTITIKCLFAFATQEMLDNHRVNK